MHMQIIGPPPTPAMRYAAERAADTRIEAALSDMRARRRLAEQRADSYTRCPDCGSSGFDNEIGYCDRCGYQRTHNGRDLSQRSAHRCSGCQVPVSGGGRCDWCKHWDSVEARATARFGTLSERQVSRLGGGW
jgi:ribosomal protein L37E